MVCPKCGSSSVNVQVVTETQITTKGKGVLWWIFIGWWWLFIKWIFFTVPALIIKIFVPKKMKAKNIQKTMCVCQSCGNTWQA